MTDQVIVCPKCGNRIALNKALTAQIENALRRTYEAKIKQHDIDTNESSKKRLEQESIRMHSLAKKELEEEIRESLSEELGELRKQLRKKDSQIKPLAQRALSSQERE